MIVEICAVTDVGRTRSQNEDSIAFDAASGLCVLADGMGGHNAGEIASGMATAFIKSDLRAALNAPRKRSKPDDVREIIMAAVTKANAAIFNMSRTNHQYSGMGTTLVVAVFCRDVAILAHIGDSRCYRLRNGALLQLTKDHSVLQEQIDSGLVIADHSMLRSIGQNLVTRALGVDDVVQTDVEQVDVAVGDIFLLCSDGLSDMVIDDGIAAILRGPESLEQKTKLLVEAANDGGGRDNISVMLAQVQEEQKTSLLDWVRNVVASIRKGVLHRQ